MQYLPPLWPQRIHAARVRVCAVSGTLPARACPQTTWTWLIAGAPRLSVCARHRAGRET